MKRRTLLASVAATGGVTATAGCLQALGTGGTDGSTRTETDDPATEPPTRSTEDDAREKDATDPEWDPDGGPVESFAVGDRDAVAFPDSNRPHGLTFWNRVDRERAVRIAVASEASGDVERLGPVPVPGGFTLAVDLQVPTRYALTAFVDAESFGTVTVGREWFDCNHSGTSYALGKTDVVDYGTASTLVYCARPAVARATVEATDRGCLSDEDARAAVSYDGEQVRIDGTVVASAPCYELSVADATYEDETRTATVVVDATAPEDEACADCVGAIEYTATVAFDRDLPDHVQVHHRDAAGDTERVATATRNG